MTQNRSFKCMLGGSNFGRYKGNPSSAAKKAFSRICRDGNIKGGKKINFSVIETTAGSDKKIYNYVGNRIKLKKPIERELPNGDIIKIQYQNKVKSKK